MKMEGKVNFVEFVTESNRIEGILRPPTDKEIGATRAFIEDNHPTVESLSALALVYTNGCGKLRDFLGANVRVGDHVAPKGGEHITASLEALLDTLEDNDPHGFHVAYETLHPFLDGNGRTGRALWAWQMFRFHHPDELALGFLHAFYYQTLSARAVLTTRSTNPPYLLRKRV